MRKAKELSETKTGQVVFLDFADRDFDQVLQMEPAVTNRAFWKRTSAVAIGDLADLVAPKTIMVCEGRRKFEEGKRPGEFDARVFRKIFSEEYPDVEFVSLGSATEVEKDSKLIAAVLGQVFSGIGIVRVIDRDAQSPSELEERRKEGFRILKRRNLESYLFDNEVLQALCNSTNQPDTLASLLSEKDRLLAESQGKGNPPDDIKAIAPNLRVAITKALKLTQPGNTTEAFGIDTLAPLVRPGMQVYAELRGDLFE